MPREVRIYTEEGFTTYSREETISNGYFRMKQISGYTKKDSEVAKSRTAV